MSTYTDASLIVTPNAYKAGKLYSIKPTSGVGDLDVVRATNATRVNEQGLIEIPRTNLLLRSEEFDNASWAKTASTVTSNATTSPNGTMTADLLSSSSTTGFISQGTSTIIGTTYTFSIYIKNIDAISTAFLGRVSSNNYSFGINWSGSVISSITNIVGNTTFQLINNGWYRITCVFNSLESSIGHRIYADNTIINKSVFIWGAQLEVGNVATEYIPTTSVIRTRFAGITQDGGSASNIPRLDYTNGSCPSILVEPQRTNVLTNSDGNLATYTTTSNVSNAGVPINGFTNSIQFGDNSVQRFSYKRNFTPIIGVEYTMSFFIQMNDNSLPVLGTSDSTGDFALIMNGNLASLKPKIQKLGTTNVYRVSVSIIATTTDTRFGVVKYPTQSVKSFKVTGCQLEAGANATSYIPTVASAVTRNADVISKTGISDLIGQTEGTMYVEIAPLTIESTSRDIEISDGNTNRVIIQFNSTGIGAFVIVGGVAQASFSFNNLDTNFKKVALKYKVNDFSLFVDGVKVAFDTSGTTFPLNTLTRLDFKKVTPSSLEYYGKVKSLCLWKTALTDAECIALTTL